MLPDRERMTTKAHEGTFWATGNSPYLDEHDSYMGVYMYKISSNCTFEGVLYLNYSSIKFI